jgi:hypothetical protein
MRKFILPLSIAAIIFIALFFWNETLSNRLKINDQKISNFFTIIGSLATATSIFLLYRQIREMQEDRKASNKPDLYPEVTTYQMLTLSGLRPNALLDIIATRTDSEDGNVNDRFLKIFNIGLGTAKEIEFEWIYNLQEVLRIIEGKYYFNPEEIPKNSRINFLSANSHAQIDIPYTYFKCCATSLNKKEIPTSEQIDVTKSDKPRLNLKILYRDIYNHSFSKLFDVIVHANYEMVTLHFKELK